jgi:conjugal transfer pilus assembly protein TraV
MSHHLRLAAALAPLCLSLAGCVGLGTNVKGQFSCRAPSGTCAPSRTIDERATKEIASPDPDSGFSAARQRAGIATPVGSDDRARTAERRLRVVFPAHVDESGILHDEAVAWTVIEAPHWAAELGANSQPSTAPLAARRSAGNSRQRRLPPKSAPMLRPLPSLRISASQRTPTTHHPSSLPRLRPSPPR